MKSIVAILFAILPAVSLASSPADSWESVKFLVGSWQGDGKAESATGKGTTVFAWELANQVLVRKDRTEYAATSGHPAYTYEALMIIYKNPASNNIEASYFDSKSHVIHYKLVPNSQPNSAQFLSDASVGPVFRLSYKLANPKDLSVIFEIQPPSSNSFQQVAAGVVHRQ